MKETSWQEDAAKVLNALEKHEANRRSLKRMVGRMWFDTQRTKDIRAMLDLVEVGANNGWMQPSTGQYFDQCLERDEKVLALLTPGQKQDLGLDDAHTPNNAALRQPGKKP